jgi:hypothetical protein
LVAFVRLKRGRAAGVLLVAAGAVLGSATDSSELPAPARTGEYWILTGDFHVHAFPGDGGLPAWELRREAARRGVHVIAITNHNHFAATRMAAGVLDKPGLPLVIQGQEITARGYHLSAVRLREFVDPRQPAAAAIAAIRSQGGAAIAAHPSQNFWEGFDTTALRTLDGTELAHPEADTKPESAQAFADFYELTRALNPDVAAIGSSDFHFAAPIGLCRTFLLTTEPTADGVLAALKAGRTVAYDKRGQLLGEQQLIDAVKPHLGALIPKPDRMASARGLSVLSVLLGFLLLIGLGAGTKP